MKRILWAIAWVPFHYVLKPLIKRNYRLRRAGLLPDEWYWAARIAAKMGYYVIGFQHSTPKG